MVIKGQRKVIESVTIELEPGGHATPAQIQEAENKALNRKRLLHLIGHERVWVERKFSGPGQLGSICGFDILVPLVGKVMGA